MVHIVLSGEQARVIEQAISAIEIRDEMGRVLGQIPAPSEQEIIERIQRDRLSGVPRFPAADVERRLGRLEEIRRREGMDETKMRHLLGKMRAGEAE